MTHVSRIRLDKATERNLIKTLELIISKVDKENTEAFLFSFLTPTERLMLAKRLAAVIFLKENIPSSQIASALRLTPSTVSKLELIMQVRGQGYEAVFKIIENEQLFKDIKKALFKLAGYAIRASGGYVKPSVV